MVLYNSASGVNYPLRPWMIAARVMSGRAVDLTVSTSGTVYMNAGVLSMTISASGRRAPEWDADPTGRSWRLKLDPLYPILAAIGPGLMRLADEAEAADDPGEGPSICVFFGEAEVEVSLWFNGYSDDHIAVRLPVLGAVE